MSLLNLAWHQPLLIPLMGEALPLREREGDRERGGKAEREREKEREECPQPGSQRILVKRRAWRACKPGYFGLRCKYVASSLTQVQCAGRLLMQQQRYLRVACRKAVGNLAQGQI